MAWISSQVTIPTGGGPIALSTAQGLQCRQIIVQNNAAHSMRIGDSTVSATKGIALSVGGGTFNSGPVEIYNSYLSDLFLFGTAADVADIFYNT